MSVRSAFAYINFAALSSLLFSSSRKSLILFVLKPDLCHVMSPPLSLSLYKTKTGFCRCLSSSSALHLISKLQTLPTMSLRLLLPPLTKILICDLLCPVALFENHAYNVPKLIKDSFHVCWTPGLEFRKSARLAVDGEFCVGGLDSKPHPGRWMCLFLWRGFQKKILSETMDRLAFRNLNKKATQRSSMGACASSSLLSTPKHYKPDKQLFMSP
jgi:hypothetical protein